MRTTMLWLVAVAACLPFAVGCSQNSQVVRGQQPDYCPPMYGGEYCDDGGWCNGWCNCQPYCVPNDLVYPPPGDMPAIVQYPYYTNKGPDCFFHDAKK
jgi:hypothetical protein